MAGLAALYRGRTYEQDERPLSALAGIYDDQKRIVVAICHNMDLGDAWEHSDEAYIPPTWPLWRIAPSQNYAMYDLTH